ncbi:MAG TPA: V-type ATP synthase subunit D [Actinocrinis sp.]|nr:V-type ATP synthase subunit D [Actinocrinis sp.]
MTTLRVPPGRAGRLRLRRRLVVAERGADLLEHKLRMLLEEQQTRRRAAQQSSRSWNEAALEADRWLTRALAAAGHDGLRQCVPTVLSRVTIDEETLMGVRFPARCGPAAPMAAGYVIDPDSAAVVCAQAAYARAVDAAARAAVDLAAARAVECAVAATRRQVRVLRRHWIPALKDALARLEATLEQADFEDGVRRRHGQIAGPTALAPAHTRRDAVIHRE